MKALLLYLVEENKLLSQVAGQSDEDILKRVIPYARASFVSSIILAVSRMQVSKASGYLVENNGVTVVSGAITPAVNPFDRKFPNTDLSFV